MITTWDWFDLGPAIQGDVLELLKRIKWHVDAAMEIHSRPRDV